MSPASDVLPIEEASTMWRQLAQRVERFVQEWETTGTPPSIAEHLAGSTLAARKMTAVELIKIDLEYRWLQHKQPRLLEDYLREFDFLAEDLPVDLIYEECHIRRQAGETFQPDDVYRRFPKYEKELRRLFGAAPALKTTTMMGRKPTLTARLEAGQRVDDFELVSKLGEGAFGTVFLARQKSMQRLVALKITADHGSEPQTLAQLDHENIVRVYDQRQLLDRGLRLMYMQFAAGGTLESVLEQIRTKPLAERCGRDLICAIDAASAGRGEAPPADSAVRTRLETMSWPEVVCYLGSRLARALDYAHQIGVLHRDVKPANVLLTTEGVPKLADFNISFSSKLEGATPAAYFGGSLAYMSPEQLEACNPGHDRTPEQLDGRSDLYSLGVLLWELLTGLKPFEDEKVERSWSLTLAQMTDRRRRGPAWRQLETITHEQAPGLDRVLATCLASETDGRFASGNELARHLELCLLPRTQQLLTVRRDGWRGLILRYPIAAVVVLTVLPNAIAGAFNYIYNKAEIVDKLGLDAKQVFEQTQLLINLVVFPIGSLIGFYRTLPLGRGVADDRLRNTMDDFQLAEMRRECLVTGRDAAVVGLSLWGIAGIAYPLMMHMRLGEAVMSTYLHFLASMLLCGLVAAAYPFMLITLMCMRRFYPLFVKLDSMGRTDRAQLETLKRLGWTFLGLAALVPLTAVAILASIGSQAQYALTVSGLGGIIGFAAAFAAQRTLIADIDALAMTTHTEIRRPSTVS